MKPLSKIVALDDFRVDESVWDDLSQDDLRDIRNITIDDFGMEDTPKRSVIVRTIVAALRYFETEPAKDLDLETKILAAAANDEDKVKLYDLAKTFAQSAAKIRKLEISEIEPVQSQISKLIFE